MKLNYYFLNVLEYLTPRDVIKLISNKEIDGKMRIKYFKYLVLHYNKININKCKINNALSMIYCFSPLPSKFRVFHLINLENHKVSNVLDRYMFDGKITNSDRIITGDRIIPYHKFIPIPFTYTYIKPNNKRYIGLSFNYYYEIKVENDQHRNSWENQCISIGYGPKNTPFVNKQVGWSYQTIGYHSDDGNIFEGNNVGNKIFNPRNWGPGDTVGAGVRYISKDTIKYFFTLNGKEIFQSKLTKMKFEILPLLGLDTSHYITANFGDKPFVYDLSPESVKLTNEVLTTKNVLIDLGYLNNKIDFIPPIIRIKKSLLPKLIIKKKIEFQSYEDTDTDLEEIPYSPINNEPFDFVNSFTDNSDGW